MNSLKDWDTPFGPSNHKEVVYPTTLDEINQWLFNSFGILPGACSSIENLRHTTARMVAEALWPKEKDLSLTIDDIERIHTLIYAVKNNKKGAFTFTRLSDEQYEEVLKRYKEGKK